MMHPTVYYKGTGIRYDEVTACGVDPMTNKTNKFFKPVTCETCRNWIKIRREKKG